jgi:hypothetical protein
VESAGVGRARPHRGRDDPSRTGATDPLTCADQREMMKVWGLPATGCHDAAIVR